LTLASGSSDKTVKYWDLELFSNICTTSVDSSDISHMSFYEENSEILFAASKEHVRVWNIEQNKMLDQINLPPKTVSDMKVAPKSGPNGLVLVPTMQKDTVTVYFSHLNSINFDENIDFIPTNQQAAEKHHHEPMQVDE